MKRLCRIVALLLLVLWPAASSHTLLEQFGLIHEDHADHAESTGSHEPNKDHHDVADGRCVLASTAVKAPSPQLIIAASVVWNVAGIFASEICYPVFPSGLAPPGTAPPEISSQWQFFFRAALPVRAPSYSS